MLPGPQIVSVHTISGVQLFQYGSGQLIDVTWGRESQEVSRCEITAPSTLVEGSLPGLVPWLHWVSVFDETGQTLHWTGPIQKVSATRDSMTVSARDMAALFTRTRCPITKRWDATDPAVIAEELLAAMIELHGLTVKPIVRPDPDGDRFDFTVVADEKMLDAVIGDLVNLGLRWTVAAGVPILGPLPRTIAAALDERDFIGEGLAVVRDGSATFNDVLLRAADTLSRARVPMGGLNLQTTVNVDSMFGVSNTDRATRQYAKYVSVIRDTITVPSGAQLHPDAPVGLDQLIPSARFAVDAYGTLLTTELTGMEVKHSAAETSASVQLDAVDDDLPELIELTDKATGGAQ